MEFISLKGSYTNINIVKFSFNLFFYNNLLLFLLIND